MLTIASRLDVMNRLGRAMADPTRSRTLMTLLAGPSYPAVLSRELELTRSNVSNHLTCLRDCGIVVAQPEGRHTRYEIADPHLAAALTALMDATLAVAEHAPCVGAQRTVPGSGASAAGPRRAAAQSRRLRPGRKPRRSRGVRGGVMPGSWSRSSLASRS